MANKKPKQNKSKTGLARCLELASNKKGLVFLSAIFSSLAAIASFVPYIAVYFIISSILKVYPNLELLDMSKVMNYGWIALAGIIANILLYFLAIFSSHMAAFGTLYELKLHFAEHITKIPLGYHLTIGSGRLRKIMDENIESIEGFIAHQFPDFVASVTAPIVMVIILLAIDWRFGIASLVGIVLAFVVQFSGFGSGAMKENMGKYQIALEDMNNASVEYVRGMPVVKAFNQTASSFARLEHAIKEYTEWVLKFSLGWQNYMPAFTTIINNIYLVIVPVGILLGANAQDYKSFTMTFIFYLLFVPAIAGILNKIMYISESFMQIDGNVARMDEIFNIPVLPQTTSPKKTQKGIHLSGGERQRIAIARAIIKDSPIIVLDEATAFSDPENEYLIQKAFEKLMQNKTVIIIAHRLSTIRNADKIIVMEKGHLVEEGKHNELVAAGGRYSQMWNHYTEAVDWKISGKAV